MRVLIHVKIPNEPFNSLVRDGTLGETMQKILEETRAEAVYFTEYEGERGAILIVDITDPAQVPALAEPWFLTFEARVEFHVAMTPDDLARAGLDALGKKWA